MKKLNILLLAFICLMSVSCDDFLDITPVGKVIPTTLSDFRALMTNAYDFEQSVNGKSLTSLRSDELSLIASKDESKISRDIYIWNDLKHDDITRTFDWLSYYKILVDVNHIIAEGSTATLGDRTDINQLIAEAHLLRAYTHFDLVNLYADVYSKDSKESLAIPLSTSIDLGMDYKRNTVLEVYRQILADIVRAIPLFSVDTQAANVNYRFSKVSAYGFAARVYMYMSEWDKASEYTQMALKLNNKLVDMNVKDARLPIEHNSVENVLAMEITLDNSVKSVTYISEKLINSYDKIGDKRFSLFFEESTKEAGRYKSTFGGSSLKNKVSMRTAEFYLNMAETQVKSHSADLSVAKDYLKRLLITRLTPEAYKKQEGLINVMTKDDFAKLVEIERMKELACQGFRWFDLRRYGKPEIKKTYEGKEYVLRKNDPRYIIPFPLEAIQNNANLKDI
jgi:hypothetical protein